MRITLALDDGTEHDVTEAVQIIYDALHASMDFGSGFLDTSEILAMHRLSRVAGWEDIVYPTDLCTCGHDRGDHYRGCRWREPEKRERVVNANGITYQVLITPPGPECPCEKFALDEAAAHAEVVVGDVPPREGNSAQVMADKWGWTEADLDDTTVHGA